jgi:hypothetical protein
MDNISIIRTETVGKSKRIVYYVYDKTLPALDDGSRPYANGSITVSTDISASEEEDLLIEDARKTFNAWVAQRLLAQEKPIVPVIDDTKKDYTRKQTVIFEKRVMAAKNKKEIAASEDRIKDIRKKKQAAVAEYEKQIAAIEEEKQAIIAEYDKQVVAVEKEEG